nr:MAG TPA_asm: Protein of unknown function (DUF3161) [Caudoviricetes sp.]
MHYLFKYFDSVALKWRVRGRLEPVNRWYRYIRDEYINNKNKITYSLML